jgi:hypothetical protein
MVENLAARRSRASGRKKENLFASPLRSLPKKGEMGVTFPIHFWDILVNFGTSLFQICLKIVKQ